MTSRLRFERATLGYRRRVVVGGAELDVSAGEIVGLVGPNGAGKSTILRAVTGDAEVIAGSIVVDGRPLTDLEPKERARLVGVVPQVFPAATGFTAREMVMMGRHPHLSRFGQPSAQDHGVVDDAMTLTDTARLADVFAEELSGGDLQRVALAQALAQQPAVLLLDEPTSHLDLNHRLQVLDLVSVLAAGGLAVLIVFHDLDLAARYADRVAVVSAGQVGIAEKPELVLTAETIREVFGVRAVVGIDAVTGAVSVVPVLREEAVTNAGRGRAFVVGGSGAAARLLRRLVLAGWSVSAGALNAGDADESVATALGVEFPLIAPFAPMDDASAEASAALATAAEVVVVTDVPFGHGNTANLAAAARAAEAGVRCVLVGDIEDRDFTGGVATKLWARAVNAGALRAPDVELAARLVEERPETDSTTTSTPS